ncbi:MAG: nucleotide exchange factor GrpE [Myxococcota bacterium]
MTEEETTEGTEEEVEELEPEELVPLEGPLAEEEIDALTAERDKLRDQLLRTAADFDNYRKRIKRDLEEVRRRAQEDAVREILPIVDNLERAVQAADSATDVQAVADGVKMVLRGFADVSERLGLERVDAIGAQFDPNVHDAVQQIESADQPAGTIMAEVVPGYTMRGRLLRAAMVVVARPPAEPEAEPAELEPAELEPAEPETSAEE